MSTTAGIVDNGSMLIFIATGAYLEFNECSLSDQCSIDAFTMYQTATGATVDQATGLLSITPIQYDVLQNLNFNIGSVRLSVKVSS